MLVDKDGKIKGQSTTLGLQDIDTINQESIGHQMIPTPVVSFDGQPNIAGVAPPDSVGDIGPNDYVAMSNLSFEIHDRSGVINLAE